MFKKGIPLILFISFILADLSFSQSRDFQTANRLMQQQNYEQAIPILSDLHDQNPSSFVFFDRLIDALIQTSELDRAEDIVRKQIDRGYVPLQAKGILGEILHLKSHQDEALEVWQNALDSSNGNIQAHYIIASSMNNRREYDEAIRTYREARDLHNNQNLFLNELANTYMQAGRFDESVNEYFQLILESPRQMAIVQQRFFQMRDQQLYDIASFELEDLMLDLSTSHEAYSSLYQLLSWLLLETEQYERAYNFARYYEEETSHTVYSLFSMGNRFLSAKQFQYAENAYEFYKESTNLSTRYRSYDELSNTYLQWANYAEQNNLTPADSVRTLYQKSYNNAEELIEQNAEYEQADRVISRLVELSLDVFKSRDNAGRWFQKLQENSGSDDPYTLYTEGRIAIFDQNFSRARQHLARADRATDQSNLSEKVRYFSALSDFFAGDSDFAEIQLQSLERRKDSYYANDAVQLRMWIQHGMRADTTGSFLNTLGDGIYELHTGNYENALEQISPLLMNPQSVLTDDLTVELSSALPENFSALKLHLINEQIDSNSGSPLLERLMWDRALLVEQILKGRITVNQDRTPEQEFFDFDVQMEFTRADAEEFFEELILSFPDGFYASFAREKLQQFQTEYL
ncbi:MAG: tetratricopeptide repeat protein [Bacteroidota bacterium]